MAAYGADRLNGLVADLATVRQDGRSRVRPVTPLLRANRLFVAG